MCNICGTVSEVQNVDLAPLILNLRNFPTTLDSLLDRTFAPSPVSGDNAYQCSKCKSATEKTTHYSVSRFPSYLCVQLARFEFIQADNPKESVTKKLVGLVRYPEHLDLTKFKNQPEKKTETTSPDEGASVLYDLYAVVCHWSLRPFLEGGHFTTYALNPSDNRWRRFSDETVTTVDVSKVIDHPDAYLLFYSLHSLPSSNPLPNPVEGRLLIQTSLYSVSVAIPQTDGIAREGNVITHCAQSSNRNCFIGDEMTSV